MRIISFITMRVLPAIVLLAMTLPAKAQWSVGVSAGYTHNWLTTTSGYYYDRVYHPQGGFTVGVPVKYSFNDWLAVGGEAVFIQKGYDARRSGYYAPLHQAVTNSYLTVPLYASFSFGGNRLRGFLNAGGFLGYWLSSHTKGTFDGCFDGELDDDAYDISGDFPLYDFDEKVSFDSRRDNRFEAGALVGVGISYLVSDRVQLNAEGRYYYSLTDMQKDYMTDLVPRYNNTISITLGVSYRFGK